jgi:hypothetical protein
LAPPAGISGWDGVNSGLKVKAWGITLARMERVERVWHRRLRWRLRGAWQWPAFLVLTLLDGVVIARLPFTGDGSDVFAGVLIAGFLNLVAVAVLAPVAGRVLRRRRPDLPRLIAADYAGTALLAAIAALLVAGGLLHRPALTEEARDERAAVASVHDYVIAQAPERRAGLAALDLMRIEPDYYRACVPGPDERRWLCLFVNTRQRPPGLKRDPDQAPNTAYRLHGGFD